jgi:hypothetical protein
MPTLPILPVDLFSRGTDITWDTFKYTTPDIYIHDYPEIIDLKVNAVAGTYDIAALTNWRGAKTLKSFSFSGKLGLEPGTPYIVFDFWNQKLLGLCRDTVAVEIEPHDTRVLLIHPLQDHPQLIGNSRHISGVYSITDLKWDSIKQMLSGKSETVKGDPYNLFVYIPDGIKLATVKVVTTDNKNVVVKPEFSENLLKIGIEGQSGVVQWEIQFTGNK